MKRAIYVRLLVIALVTALLGSGISSVAAAVREENSMRDELTRLCRIAEYQYKVNPAAKALSSVMAGERVTIIAGDGTVLDDSDYDPRQMGNHAQREEIKASRERFVTTAIRQSDTLERPYMYAAIKLEDGNVLRLAHEYGGLSSGIVGQLPIFFFTFFAAAVMALFVARAFTRKIIAPLEQFTSQITAGNYEGLPENSRYEEIDAITGRIRVLLQKLNRSGQEIIAQRDKLNYILDNMQEGFILLDQNRRIILQGGAARRVFGTAGVTGAEVVPLTRSAKIEQAVSRAIEEQVGTVFDLELGGTVYSVHVSPVSGSYVDSEKSGATILLIDVGAERLGERQRSEFFSNASHELKTPITTVMGMSEMLSGGLVKEEDKQEVYARLYTEARRMTELIGDILTISRLESGGIAEPVEQVDVTEVARTVAQELSARAGRDNIGITVKGQGCYLPASPRRVRELLENLVENAVKYNKPNGRVDIAVEKDAAYITVTVRDTGIGIPINAQGRVFERFYRVDSGRSKSVGGSGLGLAIVKHIVLSLHGKIDLKSEAGAGTVITVKLPLP